MNQMFRRLHRLLDRWGFPVHRETNLSRIQELERLGWYHSIELPNGSIIPGYQSLDVLRGRMAQFPVPADLRGKRALDIGAWDGWFSFELERRGARVLAVDSTALERFRVARELLGSQVEYVIDDVCRLSPARIGYFDVVMFLGVLYHLKHPMLALEKICELSTGVVCVESFVTDDGANPAAKPVIEFYESNELCGQIDNWVAPNVACLLAMCRSAGFARVQLESVVEQRAHVTCYRHWLEVENPQEPAPCLVSVENCATLDREFWSANDNYMAIGFRSTRPNLTRSDVFPRVGPYGTHPTYLHHYGGDSWQVNCKLPPGLAPGWHPVTLRTRNSPWADPLRIGVDLSPMQCGERSGRASTSGIRIVTVTDGRTGEPDLVHTGAGGSISVWVSGLPQNAVRDTTAVWLDGHRLPSVSLSEPDSQGLRRIDAMLPPGAPPGARSVLAGFGAEVSARIPVRLV